MKLPLAEVLPDVHYLVNPAVIHLANSANRHILKLISVFGIKLFSLHAFYQLLFYESTF